jgi:2-polyprenyl-6-methoxyphenol hydroxylase-like FAD-dependent oxidoreductase
MAGLCAARVLADRFDSVVIVDRDELPEGPEARRRVPQGRHPHLLLAAGTQLLEGWFPGIRDELRQQGAIDVDICSDFYWYQAGGCQRRPSSALVGPSMSRPLLEVTVRERVRALSNVELVARTAAEGAIADPSNSRIVGVRLDDGRTIPSTLLVDASGRTARTLKWIKDLGFDVPPTSVVHVDTHYVSRIFRRVAQPDRDWKAAAYIGEPASKHLAMALPMENERWILSIAGMNGESAPTDLAGFLNYARRFESPAIAELIESSAPLGDAVTHRFPSNQRRHVERMRSFPLGWVLLGDAVCSVDPIYGQGMSSAAQQADTLARMLDRCSTVDRSFARGYFKAVGHIVATPWSIAVGGDFAYEHTTGKKPLGTDLMNRYFDRVVKAGQRDDQVTIRINEVVSLVRTPQTLMAPAFALRVLRASRRRSRLDQQALPPRDRTSRGHLSGDDTELAQLGGQRDADG